MTQKQLIAFLAGFKENFQNVLAIIVLVSCFGTNILILRGWFNDNQHIAEIRTGNMAVLIMIVQYYFGSSRGSANKEKIIGTLTEANAEEKKD
jgi:hypothetical protein